MHSFTPTIQNELSSKVTTKVDTLKLFHHLHFTFRHILTHELATILSPELTVILHNHLFTIHTNNTLPTFDVTMDVKFVNKGYSFHHLPKIYVKLLNW